MVLPRRFSASIRKATELLDVVEEEEEVNEWIFLEIGGVSWRHDGGAMGVDFATRKKHRRSDILDEAVHLALVKAATWERVQVFQLSWSQQNASRMAMCEVQRKHGRGVLYGMVVSLLFGDNIKFLSNVKYTIYLF